MYRRLTILTEGSPTWADVLTEKLLRCDLSVEILNLLDRIGSERAFLAELASLRVVNPLEGELNRDPFPVELDVERDILEGNFNETGLYDGAGLLFLYSRLLGDLMDRSYVVVLTSRLIGTPDPAGRYHIRYGLYGDLAILSPRGVVEGPARPREYYMGRTEGLDFLVHQDPRVAEALFWFVLMQLRYVMLGSPFCERRGCRFFNPHWQSELIESQIEGRVCSYCQGFLEGIYSEEK